MKLKEKSDKMKIRVEVDVMNYKNGEEFLNKLYQNMHMESTVMHTAEKSDKPTEKISKYLNRLENVHDKANTSKHKMDLLKYFYYEKYVIKDLPESYIELQKKIAREEGHGDIYVTDMMKEKMLEQVQFDQKVSLDSWIEYLSSNDAMYPMWFKNYAFQGMIKLNKFDKEKGEFGKRSKTTTEPYLELNREVLAQVYDTLSKKIGENKELTEEEQKALENGESFKKLYTYYLKKTGFVDNNKENVGIWVKYNQGDDYYPLWESLQGKNTGWCTAGEATAKTQLKNGDFYVYYSIDKNGEYTNPRLAIRMDGKNNIGEIRGIGKDQNIEGTMNDVLEEKLNEFSDKDSYLKKTHDMKLLTLIEKKENNNQQLTKDELQFLYELNYKIDGFGWEKDPRIEEIRKKRNKIDDLNYLFSSIKIIEGDLDLSSLTSAEGLKLPDSLEGSLDLRSLTSAEGLKLPNSIGENLDLRSLTSAEGLKLPDSIGWNLKLDSLTSAEGLKLPDSLEGSLDLRSLASAEGLKLPDSLEGSLDLRSLTSAEGLKLPDSLEGSLDLSSLTSAEGLKLPNSIGRNLYLGSLTSAEGLKLPNSIGRDLYLDSLTSAEGLKLPDSLEGSLDLRSLTSAEGLKLPDSIGRDLYLDSLTSAEGLKLPDSIGRDLYLDSLTSAEGLKLPDSIGRDLYLGSLTSAEGLKLPDSIGWNLKLDSLTSAEGLVAPVSWSWKIQASDEIKAQIQFIPYEKYKLYRKVKVQEQEIKKMTESFSDEQFSPSNKKK